MSVSAGGLGSGGDAFPFFTKTRGCKHKDSQGAVVLAARDDCVIQASWRNLTHACVRSPRVGLAEHESGGHRNGQQSGTFLHLMLSNKIIPGSTVCQALG